MPGLAFGVALGTAPLQVERDGEQAVPAPRGHDRDQLAGVALGVPLLRIRVRPAADRHRVAVVENGLHHARVEEQPFDLVAVPDAARVGRCAVDEELFSPDGDCGLARPLLVAAARRTRQQAGAAQAEAQPGTQGNQTHHNLPTSPVTIERFIP